MIIFRYDKLTKPDELTATFLKMRDMTEDDILVLPQEWDAMFNVSLSDLRYYRRELDKIIEEKEKMNES